jgi:phosphoglycolate phosphatase
MTPHSILFDLDGTLIDSAPGILASFGAALQRTGLAPAVPLEASLIGPPLPVTAATLVGRDDPAAIAALIAAFRTDYDEAGYRATAVYAGVPRLLETLAATGIALRIVTNKRIAPTRRILEHLGWTAHFAGVHALDATDPPAPHKPAMVAAVLRAAALLPERTWMVGDSAEDRRAAETNGLRFFAAGWGYGAAASGSAGPSFAAPDQAASTQSALTDPLALLAAVEAGC